MASSVAQNVVVRREQQSRRASMPRRTRTLRRPRTRLGKNLKYAFAVMVLVCAFGYVSLYASLTATSFEHSRLANELRLEKIKNERLRIDYIRRSSPAFAMSAAQKAGMVYAVQYDYLPKSNTVANASQDR